MASTLKHADILTPKAHRRTKREHAKKLKLQHKNTSLKRERQVIEQKIIALEDAHLSRPH